MCVHTARASGARSSRGSAESDGSADSSVLQRWVDSDYSCSGIEASVDKVEIEAKTKQLVEVMCELSEQVPRATSMLLADYVEVVASRAAGIERTWGFLVALSGAFERRNGECPSGKSGGAE